MGLLDEAWASALELLDEDAPRVRVAGSLWVDKPADAPGGNRRRGSVGGGGANPSKEVGESVAADDGSERCPAWRCVA
eukprot:7345507-Alexandrium_andersonii.AAC.1